MRKRFIAKIAALIIVAVITMVSTIPAYALFGPTNNQAGELTTYTGEFSITDGITAHPDNKIVITLPDADLSAASGGSLTDIPNPVNATLTFDDVAKTATFAFEAGIAGGSISITLDNIASPVGEHPYTVEIFSGESTTSVALEVGTYVIHDNGLTVNLNVSKFFSFGLTSESLSINLASLTANSRTERAMDWQVSTNADSYVVSCRLKTPLTNGSHTFPSGKPGYTPIENHQSCGIHIGGMEPNGRSVTELVGYYTGISESSMTIATGGATNLDQDRISLILFADASIKPGVYIGVIEFTGTPTF